MQTKRFMSAEMQARELRLRCMVKERSKEPIIRATGLVYNKFGVPSPEVEGAFLKAFGLIESAVDRGVRYYRGGGSAHHCIELHQTSRPTFLGAGFEVSSLEDLNRVAKAADRSVEECRDPAGGFVVELVDPDGIPVELRYKMARVAPIKHPPGKGENRPEKTNRPNDTVRIPPVSPLVHRLGHYVTSAKNPEKTIQFYQDFLGMIVSDFQFAEGDPIPFTAFMRLDRGNQPTDHHTVAIGAAPFLGHLHSAFELHSLDDLAMCNRILAEHRYRHSWGIGRHVLGSQIFDYWRDPYGFQFEHYIDGDVFDNRAATGYYSIAGFDSHHQWGPLMTKDFMHMRPAQIIKTLPGIVKRLLDADDPLSIRRLKQIEAGLRTSTRYERPSPL